MKIRVRHVWEMYQRQICLGILGIPIGMIIGILDTIFGKVLLEITAIRDTWPFLLIPFLPIGGIVIVFCYNRIGKESGKGMSLIFEAGHGERDEIPMRLIPLIIGGTWVTHLFGGSAGREGVAVQIGAAFSHWVGKRIPMKKCSDVLLIAGMGAGFSGLFQTPAAAVLFAMEVLTMGRLRYDAFFPTVTASFAAAATSHMLGLEKFTFQLAVDVKLDGGMAIKLLAAGILFGIAGGMFGWFLRKTKSFFADKLKNPLMRIFITGIFLSIVFLFLGGGRYSGLGTNLIHACFYGEDVYLWDWLLKAVLTVVTLAVGFQGGEVTPLFATGATLGTAAAGFLGLPIPFAAAMGYAALFGSATNTFLSAVLIGAEVFGYEYLPYFFLVCATAYVFNMNQSIYALQKKEC